jgi:DNA-binding CsgD family transcriptional regulator
VNGADRDIDDVATVARIARLTDGQRAVLSRVARHRSSKEIARELGISPHTVDQRLKRVQSILNVRSRFEAARLYADSAERVPGGVGIWEGLVYQPPELSPAAAAGTVFTSTDAKDRSVDGYAMHQAQAAYLDAGMVWSDRRSWFSVLLEAGRKNELSALARTLCIGGLALTAVLVLSAVVSLAEGLSRIF